MKMPIPKTIRIGRKTYRVTQPQQMRKTATKGDITYEEKHIQVARACTVTERKYSPKERAETFWHEVTHGILEDMDHPLATSEKFVDAFAKRLNGVIHSAKF